VVNNRSLNIRVIFLLLVGSLLIAACGQQVATEIQPPSSSSVAPEPAPVSEAPVMVAEPVALVETPDECLLCHTDKQRLIDTAKPEEDLEAENKGEG
jgi:hypothetical protein